MYSQPPSVVCSRMQLPLLPREIIQIIFSHRPWAALLLSREWNEWATATIDAIPIQLICPQDNAGDTIISEYMNCAADSRYARACITARGEYTATIDKTISLAVIRFYLEHNQQDIDCISTRHTARYRPGVVIFEQLYGHDVWHDIQLYTPRKYIKVFNSIEYLDIDRDIAIAIHDNGFDGWGVCKINVEMLNGFYSSASYGTNHYHYYGSTLYSVMCRYFEATGHDINAVPGILSEIGELVNTNYKYIFRTDWVGQALYGSQE